MTILPTHICIGMARSGTTWLFEALSGIDALFVPPAKEVRYWFGAPAPAQRRAHIAHLDRTRSLTDEERDWLDAWAQADTNAVSGAAYSKLMGVRGLPTLDISPSYAAMPEDRIKELKQALHAGSKVFVLFRNPYHRLKSEIKLHAFLHGKFRGPATDWMIEDFCSSKARAYQRDYTRIMTHWSNVFGENFRAFYYEDIAPDPKQFIHSVLGFLGVDNVANDALDMDKLRKVVATDVGTPYGSVYPKLTRRQEGIVARATVAEIDSFTGISADRAASWREDIKEPLLRFPKSATVQRDESPDYQRLLRLTESVGDNCEFGFVQRSEGYEPSSLFRWAVAAVDPLIRHLKSPAPLFTKQALRVVESDLIFDSASGFYFHSDLVEGEGGARRLVPEDRFDEIWSQEKAKVDHLAYKFWHFSVSRPGIYVIKSNGGVDAEALEKLAAALQDRHPQHKLLHVAAGGTAGVDRQQGAIIHARIPAFADYAAANQVDMTSWRKVLNDVLDIPEVRDMVDTMFV